MVAEGKLKLSLDGSQFNQEIKSAGDNAETTFSEKMGSVKNAIAAAFTIEKVTAFLQEVMNAAAEVQATANQLDLSAESVQSLGIVAQNAGSNFGEVEQAVIKLNAAALAAKGGNEDMAESFEAIGISVEDLENLSTDELFDTIATKVKEADGNSTELQKVFDILGGTTGQKLKSTLIAIADEGLEKLNEKNIEANRIMSDESVKNWAALKSTMDDALATLRVWVGEYGGGFLTALKDGAAKLGEWSTGLSSEQIAEDAKVVNSLLEEANTKIDAQKQKTAALEAEKAKVEARNASIATQEQLHRDLINAQKTNAELLNEERGKLKTLEDELKTINAKTGDVYLEQLTTNNQITISRQKVKELEEKISKENGTQARELALQKLSAKALEETAKARDGYEKAVADAHWDQLDLTGKIELIEGRRKSLVEDIANFEALGLTDTQEYYLAKTQLIGIEDQLKGLNAEQANQQGKTKEEAVATVKEALALREELRGLTDREMKQLISSITTLAEGIAKLPKVDSLSWIKDLMQLDFGGITDSQARQMVRGIATLITGLKELPKLDQDMFKVFEQLKNIEFVSLTDSQARQMVRAIKTLISELKTVEKLPADLFDALVKFMAIDFSVFDKEAGSRFKSGIKEVAEGLKSLGGLDKGTIMSALELIGALKDLKSVSGGDYSLKIELPEGMESGVPLVIETAFNENVKSISTSLSELVKMKGIVWA